MKELINKLSTVTLVLNTIDVSGKKNLLNLGGAIDIIEGVIKELNDSCGAEKQDSEHKEQDG